MDTRHKALCRIHHKSAVLFESVLNKMYMHTQKDFGFRFEWMAQNAFRDSAKLTQAKAFEICQIFTDAETQMKSTPLDERILLETAVIRAVQALGGGR